MDRALRGNRLTKQRGMERQGTSPIILPKKKPKNGPPNIYEDVKKVILTYVKDTKQIEKNEFAEDKGIRWF